VNEEIEKIKNRIKSKRTTKVEAPKKEIKNNTYLKKLFSRSLITIILVLISVIYINSNEKNLLKYKDIVFTKNLSFAKINNWYQKNFGKIIPVEIENETQTVFSDKLIYSAIDNYYDGYKLTVAPNSIINNITSGIIVYIGEKENYGNVVIVQGIDGVDVWYGNIIDTNLTLYDYIEEGTIIGESKDEHVYFVLSKDGEYLNYEEYINKNKN